MYGPEILISSISAHRTTDRHGNRWQYNPRSDYHSKVACWAILFDLLRSCETLRGHVASGSVHFGINHQMVDFSTGRHKDLDLVLCLPRQGRVSAESFAGLVTRYGLRLSDAATAELDTLPVLRQADASDVLLAMEAKACMTEHSKAAPRFYDELSSAAQCINGGAERAIAVGFAMLNASETFVSPTRNGFPMTVREPAVTTHRQPKAVEKIESRFRELRLRDTTHARGYDAMGIVIIQATNDLTPVVLAPSPPAPATNDPFHYEMMIRRISAIYSNRFAAL